MARAAMQKRRILVLLRMLERDTDEGRGLTVREIVDRYRELGITAERKSVYDDFAALCDFGVDVDMVRENGRTEYRLLSRQFELAELKILVDAVQSAKFITPKKSDDLIAKLSMLTSDRQSSELKRYVYVADRVKSSNESVYYAIDAIHSAIRDARRVSFLYFDLNEKKEKVYRHGGERCEVSPYALVMDDGKYYLVAYDLAPQKIKHYRVDKIERLEISDAPRDGGELFGSFNAALYAKEHFGMYGGEETLVTLYCANRLAQVVLDRFGQDVTLNRRDEGHFEVSVRVACSVHFLAWVLSLAPEMKVIAPRSVREQMRSMLRSAIDEYDVQP